MNNDMKNSIEILTATDFDNFFAIQNKFETETNQGIIKTRLGFIYFVAVFCSLILLFA